MPPAFLGIVIPPEDIITSESSSRRLLYGKRVKDGSLGSKAPKTKDCGRRDVLEKLAELRGELSQEDYYQLIIALRQAINEDKSICDDDILDVIDELRCDIAPEDISCRPDSWTQVVELYETLYSLGIYSAYGPDWESQVAAVCAELGESNPTCLTFAGAFVD